MPIYEFHCAQCEQDHEVLVRSSTWKGTKCPNCGSSRLSKKLSVFASSGAAPGAKASAGGAAKGGGSCGGCGCGRKHQH
jgi:putative FmdB family regulatory protein